MTDLTAVATPPTQDARLRWLAPLVGLVLTAGASIASLSIAGPLQGSAFSSVLLVTLIVPALAVGGRTALVALSLAIAVGLAAAVGPAIALREGTLNTRTFIPTAAVVLTFSLAAAGITLLLVLLAEGTWRGMISASFLGLFAGLTASAVVGEAFWSAKPLLSACVAAVVGFALLYLIRKSPFAAAWVVSLLLAAWLTWPIWLSPWLPGREDWVDVLSPAHPLLSLDAALVGENVPPWTEHRLMYSRLTVLQQHVMSRPPHDVLATILLNLALATPGFAATGIIEILTVIRRLRAAALVRQFDEPEF